MKKIGYTEKKEQHIVLDQKDKKILHLLDFDARLPYTILAKKVGVSKQGAEYKVRALQKAGVIRGFYPVINVPKLGYLYCRMLLTFQNITAQKKEEIMKTLKEHKKVFWLLEMHGAYDLLVVIWAKTVSEYVAFAEEIQNLFGAYMKKKKETIATDVIHLEHRYLLGLKETKEIHIRETQERIVLDEMDKNILKILCENARVSLVEIALRLKISAKVIAYRIKKMEKQRIIEAYRPIIDHTKIGYTYYKLFVYMNQGTKDAAKKVKGFIKQHPATVYMVEGFGLPADLDIEIMVHSTHELIEFINTLRFSFPTIIGEYETVLFGKTQKVKYLPF